MMTKKYSPGQICDFEVVKEYGDDEDFFRFRVPDVGEGRLLKLRFQKAEPLPDRLRCRIKYVNDGRPVLSHYMPQYVSRFYGAGARHGREFEFTVLSLPARAGDPYILEDKYGMRFNLRDGRAGDLTLGCTVMCRFTKINDTYFNLECSTEDMRLTFIPAEVLLRRIGVPGILRSQMLGAMSAHPSMADAAEEHAHSNPRWPLTAMQSAIDALPKAMAAMNPGRHHRYLRAVVDVLIRSGLYLIENSRFLRNQSDDVRGLLQARITRMVESLEPYRQALGLFRDGAQVAFVEELMGKLRESGYLYHPARQFAVLMAILRSDPLLVRDYLGRIFETIMEWKLDTWTTEPFRSAFVGQFEIYIRHASAQLEALPQADSQADKDLLEKIVTAVALQTLIGTGDPDRQRRNRSLLYRCIALLRPASADVLLDKAYLTLNGARIPVEYKYDHIKQPLMLMTRAMVPPTAEQSTPDGVAVFASGNIAVTVGPDGVAVRRGDESSDTRVLPSGLIPGEIAAPQVYLDNITPLSAAKLGNLEAHRRLWSDIETALTEQRTAPASVVRERVRADVDDEVFVVINPDEVTGTDDPEWTVRIDDESYLPGTGTILRSEIVDFALRAIDLSYNPRAARESFIDDDGRPRHFLAKVTAVDRNGAYTFSMADDIDSQRHDLISFSKSCNAVITQRLGHEYRSISELGYGFYLTREPGDPEYRPGTVVEMRPMDISNPSHMVGTIVGEAPSGSRVEKMTAFRALMSSICVIPAAGTSAPAPATPASAEVDQTLTVDDMRELIEIFRFRALSSSTILTAYDYLLFARLLAIAVGDAGRAESLRVHASLLRLHQFYAANSRVDADELNAYRPLVEGNPLLEIMYRRLEIVSWLGKTDMCPRLWDTVNAPRNTLESTLARMVMAYNMLPESGRSDDAVARGLKGKIAALLGVNAERTELKSYGREGQFVEFKSSIVYPARKNKNDKVEADPARQQRVILKIIASFINSSGGTLYIGVNDATRCASGLFEDFEYYRHRKGQIGTYLYEMKTLDNFCVFLENLVRTTWGSLVAGSVQIRVDDEATRDVIIVEVQPRVTPVKLDDKYYVRRSSTSVELNPEESAEFEAERAAMKPAAVDTAAVQAAEPRAEEPVAPEAVSEADSGSCTPIPTSGWRPNVQHSYEDSFSAPAGYVYFTGDDTVQYSSQDLYLDSDPGCRLAMVFTAEEAAKGWLVAVYEGARVQKIPLSDIIDKGENRSNVLLSGERPVFATVAMPGQALLTIHADGRSNMYRRVTMIDSIDVVRLGNAPGRLLDAGTTAPTIVCELVASSAVSHFRQGLSSNMSARQIGYALKCAAGAPRAAKIIQSELAACAPRV